MPDETQPGPDERVIVLGHDAEQGGADVLRLGRLLAAVLAAKPLVMTALPWSNYLMDAGQLQKLADAETREKFAAIRDEFGKDEVETRAVARRSPAEALQTLAEDEGAEMIVLGSSHRGAFGRTFPGSVAESLLHGSPCAIAVAPRGYAERQEHRLYRIAIAFDGSPESWAALETGIGLAEHCHGELTVITVAEPHYGYGGYGSALAAADLRDAERDEKRDRLDLALSRTPSDLHADGRLLTGGTGTLLAQASADFDLMVVGSRGYGPLRRTLLGSATRHLLQNSGCPVLVLPRGIGIDPLGLRPGAARPITQEMPA